MKVLVCGGRDFTNFDLLERSLNTVNEAYGPLIIIHGNARGADTLAGQYAVKYGLPLQVYPANWDLHKKAAGFIRNQQMLDEGKPDVIVAFPGGRGTEDMIKRGLKVGVKVIQFDE